MTVAMPSREDLARLVAERPTSLFESDLDFHRDGVAAAVQGRRVLVIGGAGSIGAPTVRELCAFGPAVLHIVDADENGLAELIRDLRSRDAVRAGTDLRTTPLDFGGPIMARLLREEARYDLVLNFAAVKHVRSEKDVLSLLRMLDVNVVAARRLLDWLHVAGANRYFAVSTDKAANPVNIMGATKRAMELVLLDARIPQVTTSARFANVAFSNGSLLDGWLRRLEKRQPWAVPTETMRFFVTPQEAGQLCALAATAAPDRDLLIPNLDPAVHLRNLQEVAEQVLAELGLTPVLCHSEAEAREVMGRVRGSVQWPLLLTVLDTSGEKAFEEFAAPDDVVGAGGFTWLRTLTTPRAEPADLDSFMVTAHALVNDLGRRVTSDDVVMCLKSVVPDLMHRKSGKSLDAQM